MLDRFLTGPRAIARDLIEKRLWPVALLLLVALVAVPVVLGGSDHNAPATPAAALPTPAEPGADTAITVSQPAVLGRSRPGKVDDPFYHPPKPAAESTGTATTAAPSSSSSSSSSTPSTSTTPSQSGTNSGGTGAPTPSTQTPATPATTVAGFFYRARVRFGADENAPVRGLSRLEALGDKANPAALYLGPNARHTHAVFLLGPEAVVTAGNGACGETTCRVVVLKAGESATIVVAGKDGAPGQTYVLGLDEMHEQKVATEAALTELRGRVDPDGRDVLRSMILDKTTAAAVGKLTYDPSLGAVVLVATL
jgi:hypothetical protein